MSQPSALGDYSLFVDGSDASSGLGDYTQFVPSAPKADFGEYTHFVSAPSAAGSTAPLDPFSAGHGIEPSMPGLSKGSSVWKTTAMHFAQQYGIPGPIFDALVHAESQYDPTAVSKSGAIGLTQLEPGTAKELGVDPHDPLQNLQGGAQYLAQKYKQFGSWPIALAAYNAGSGAVNKYGGGIPPYPETRNYVSSILGRAGWTPGPGSGEAGEFGLERSDRVPVDTDVSDGKNTETQGELRDGETPRFAENAALQTTGEYISQQFNNYRGDAASDIEETQHLKNSGCLNKIEARQLDWTREQAQSLQDAAAKGEGPPQWFAEREGLRHAELVRNAVENGNDVPLRVLDSLHQI